MIVAVVSAVAMGLYTKFTVVPTYASTIKFCLVTDIETNQNTTAANERNLYMYANELMETCIEAIQTEDAISEMNGFLQELDGSYSNLGLRSNNVSVEQVSDTSNNFHVTIKTTDPKLSCDACYAFESMARVRAPKVGSLTLETIDTPKVAVAPISSGTLRNAIVAFIGGFIISAMIFVVITVLDNTVKDSTAVCEDFDILLLAEIPNINQATERDKAYESLTHSKGSRGSRYGK